MTSIRKPSGEFAGFIAALGAGKSFQEAATEAVLKYGVAAAFELVLQYWFALTNRGAKDLGRSDAETGAAALRRFVEETRARLSALEATPQRDSRLEGFLVDHQFWRLQKNYAIEWMREPMDERRRMLEFAAAGAVNVDLTVGQLARVERVLRELDPDDALELGRLAAIGGALSVPPDTPSGQALIASGCIYFDRGDKDLGVNAHLSIFGAVGLTDVGEKVLHVLRGYITARRSP